MTATGAEVHRFQSSPAISEDRVHTADFAFIADGLADNVRDIWQ
jgi:hypothetical protein